MGRRLDADSLLNQLKKTPSPSLDALYVVSGDEPLLVIEASDAIRAAATQSGYGERVSLVLDARSDWSDLIGATQNVSLFGDRRLVDLAIPRSEEHTSEIQSLMRISVAVCRLKKKK